MSAGSHASSGKRTSLRRLKEEKQRGPEPGLRHHSSPRASASAAAASRSSKGSGGKHHRLGPPALVPGTATIVNHNDEHYDSALDASANRSSSRKSDRQRRTFPRDKFPRHQSAAQQGRFQRLDSNGDKDEWEDEDSQPSGRGESEKSSSSSNHSHPPNETPPLLEATLVQGDSPSSPSLMQDPSSNTVFVAQPIQESSNNNSNSWTRCLPDTSTSGGKWLCCAVSFMILVFLAGSVILGVVCGTTELCGATFSSETKTTTTSMPATTIDPISDSQSREVITARPSSSTGFTDPPTSTSPSSFVDCNFLPYYQANITIRFLSITDIMAISETDLTDSFSGAYQNLTKPKASEETAGEPASCTLTILAIEVFDRFLETPALRHRRRQQQGSSSANDGPKEYTVVYWARFQSQNDTLIPDEATDKFLELLNNELSRRGHADVSTMDMESFVEQITGPTTTPAMTPKNNTSPGGETTSSSYPSSSNVTTQTANPSSVTATTNPNVGGQKPSSEAPTVGAMNPTYSPTILDPPSALPATTEPSGVQPADTTSEPLISPAPSVRPTTYVPTSAPTTLKPTSPPPTTPEPTTAEPTTVKPTTVAPTRPPPTTQSPSPKPPRAPTSIGPPCDDDADCAGQTTGGVCGYVDSNLGQKVCCQSSPIVMAATDKFDYENNYYNDFEPFCPGEAPPGSNCLYNNNAICTDGTCVNNICVKGPTVPGSICDEDDECQSGACGYVDSNLEERICCQSGPNIMAATNEFDYENNYYTDWEPFCPGEAPPGSNCLYNNNDICSDGTCVNHECVAGPMPLVSGSSCDEHLECASGSCGYIDSNLGDMACCKTNSTISAATNEWDYDYEYGDRSTFCKGETPEGSNCIWNINEICMDGLRCVSHVCIP